MNEDMRLCLFIGGNRDGERITVDVRRTGLQMGPPLGAFDFSATVPDKETFTVDNYERRPFRCVNGRGVETNYFVYVFGGIDAVGALIAGYEPQNTRALEHEIDRLKKELEEAKQFQLIGEASLANRDALRERLGLDRGDNLHEHVDGLRKNSDRYQWLRDKSQSVHQFYLSVPLWFTGVRFRAQDVDDAIDAMSKGEQS